MEDRAGSGARDSARALLSQFIEEDDLWRLFDYWRSKRRGRSMPALADLDPMDFSWALSRISLLDYDPETGFRYRLAGAEPSAVFGRGNLKGLTFHDLMPADGARIVEERWLPVVTERSVCCMKGMVYLAAEQTAIGERIVLPLADDPEGPVSSVLGMTICRWTENDAAQEVKLSRTEYISVAEIP